MLVTKNIIHDYVSFLIAEELICEEKEKGERTKYLVKNREMNKPGWVADFFIFSFLGTTSFSELKKELFWTGIISGVIYCGSGI